jgi:hypothetical protein
MARNIYDTDPNGMKLFGKCKYIGECRCGGCDLAPANQQNEVTVTRSDGTQKRITAPAVHPDEYETGTYGFNHEPQLAAKTGQSDKPIPPKSYKLPDPFEVDAKITKPIISTPVNNCGYCRKRGTPCVRHGGMRAGNGYLANQARRNGPVTVTKPPVQESAKAGNLDEPLAEPKIDSKKPLYQFSDNENHEVTIRLAGIEIIIKPLGGGA